MRLRYSFRLYPRLILHYFVKECLGILEVSGVKARSVPALQLRQHLTGLSALAPVLLQEVPTHKVRLHFLSPCESARPLAHGHSPGDAALYGLAIQLAH